MPNLPPLSKDVLGLAEGSTLVDSLLLQSLLSGLEENGNGGGDDGKDSGGPSDSDGGIDRAVFVIVALGNGGEGRGSKGGKDSGGSSSGRLDTSGGVVFGQSQGVEFSGLHASGGHWPHLLVVGEGGSGRGRESGGDQGGPHGCQQTQACDVFSRILEAINFRVSLCVALGSSLLLAAGCWLLAAGDFGAKILPEAF